MKIHHIAVLVADLESALPFWRDVLGLELDDRKVVASEGADIAFLRIGDSLIELVQPLSVESTLTQQLGRPGTKLHHLCLEVTDLDVRLAKLRVAGVALINEEARQHEDGTRYAFIHPRSACGVLLELYETPA